MKKKKQFNITSNQVTLLPIYRIGKDLEPLIILSVGR